MKNKFIGVISDTHISSPNTLLPKEVYESFKGAEAIFHLGDITEPYVLDELTKIAPVHAVYGNMDSPALKKTLPERTVVQIDGLKFAMMHGFGSYGEASERVYSVLKSSKPDCILFGHTHLPFNKVIDNITLFNPGSSSGLKNYNRSVGILDITDTFISPRIIKF